MQLALDLGVPPQSPIRAPVPWLPDTLFFAVVPTPAAAARIAERAERLRHQHGLRAKRRPTELLHVTLNAVGSFSGLPADVLAATIYAGGSVKMAPFKVTFDRALSFRTKPPLPFVLHCGHGTADLTALRNEIGAATRGVGLRCGDRSNFTPHVTMLYDQQSVPEMSINEPITWTVREFVLVHSLRGKSQHVYRARWPLNG